MTNQEAKALVVTKEKELTKALKAFKVLPDAENLRLVTEKAQEYRQAFFTQLQAD